jgi:hypothetical protein
VATKTKGKKPAAGDAAATNGRPAAPVRIDVTKLEDELFDWRGPRDVLAGAKFDKAKERVVKLRAELQDAEEELEFVARGLRVVEAAVQKALAMETSGEQIYDGPLRDAIAKVRATVKQDYFGGKWCSNPTKTGAIAWRELVRDGATDAQIQKNLASLEAVHSGAYRIETKGKTLTFTKRVPDGKHSHSHTWKSLLAGDKLVAEVRRVKGLPQPAATMKAPAAKPAPKTSPKRKSSSSSKTAKSKPKSGAQKRREAKERAEKTAATAPADREGEPNKGPTAFGYALQVPKSNDFSTLAKVMRKRIDELAADRSADLTNLPLPVKDAILAIRLKQLGDEVGAECAQPPGTKCIECKCDEDHACEGGCWWVRHPEDPKKPLCSKCLQKVLDRMVASSEQRGASSELGDALGFNRASKRAPGVVDHNEVPPAIAKRGQRARPSVAQIAAAKRNGRAVGV